MDTEELANKIGVTKQVVSNWERNVARPEINHLISLAEVFDVTTDYLLCIANQMTFPYCVESIDTIHSDLNIEKIKWELKFSLIAIIISREGLYLSCSSSLNVP
ncbi:transcriptional regulator with XRE-family HTH domain [Paenibacillus polymyxa]|uniref:helix-turn-helix domain-containing protein n=1 Tax=Paenibacillus polymyxa TaxID=1406 RepID=UPI00278C998D|nr:helix-turn-helix transcriptional regulator [Paenibacillus polymyxa]MDQ0049900.1 transcriptional regulator with XRE-family HTH domain [Paenibacillus polymyxa]